MYSVQILHFDHFGTLFHHYFHRNDSLPSLPGPVDNNPSCYKEALSSPSQIYRPLQCCGRKHPTAKSPFQSYRCSPDFQNDCRANHWLCHCDRNCSTPHHFSRTDRNQLDPSSTTEDTWSSSNECLQQEESVGFYRDSELRVNRNLRSRVLSHSNLCQWSASVGVVCTSAAAIEANDLNRREISSLLPLPPLRLLLEQYPTPLNIASVNQFNRF